MRVFVNTGNDVDGGQELTARVRNEVTHALRWFSDRLTRVDVYLTDENSDKGGSNDRRCVMEAHVAGREPIVATEQQSRFAMAYAQAAEKLQRAVKRDLDRVEDNRRGIDRE